MNAINDYTTRGTHVIADVHEFDYAITSSHMRHAAKIANMTVLGQLCAKQSIALILAESHMTVHYVCSADGDIDRYFIDVFTCGDTADPMAAVMALLERCGAKVAFVAEFARGTDKTSL